MVTVTSVEATPRERFGFGRHAALSAFWFGSNFLWIPLTTVLMQSRIDLVVPKD